MLLGDVIANLEDEAAAMEALVGFGDLSLLARVEEAASQQDLTAGEFAAQAVRVFCARASDQDWVSLIGVMGQTDNPGQICLKKIVEFALHPLPTCGLHE
jgi:hypothetical protein